MTTGTSIHDTIIVSVDRDDWKINYQPPFPDKLPPDYYIGPAFPNPCSDSTFIFVAFSGKKLLNIYIKDENGNKIRTIHNDTLTAGDWSLFWFLDDNEGNRVENGIYRCYYNFELTRNDGDTVCIHNASGYGDIKVE